MSLQERMKAFDESQRLEYADAVEKTVTTVGDLREVLSGLDENDRVVFVTDYDGSDAVSLSAAVERSSELSYPGGYDRVQVALPEVFVIRLGK